MNSEEIIDRIDKREVAFLKWPKEDISMDEQKNMLLLKKLHVAVILGNIEKHKCKIFFEDSVGLKSIETTICAVCDKNISIKSGIWIPINRIIDLKF